MISALTRSHRTRVEMLGAWARHDVDTFNRFTDTMTRFGVDVRQSSVLDLGCGSNAPLTVILHSQGARVIGVDTYLGYRWGLGFRASRYVHYAREVGLGRAARKFLGECVYDRTYYKTLADSVGVRLSETGLDLRRMDLTQLEFDDASFDVIHSNATWEHVGDVAKANREVARILRPGGIAYIEIHLFPSLSGGHDLPWIVPGKTDIGGMVPWRHLRQPQWQAPVFLNRLRERDYAEYFRATDGLALIDWITEYTEGADLLTDDIRRELTDYSYDDLTKRSIIAVVRKIA